MLHTTDYNIYHMPCGDACSTTPPPVTDPPVTAPPATGAYTTTNAPEFTYVGCFADTLEGRVFTAGEYSIAGMNSEVCTSSC